MKKFVLLVMMFSAGLISAQSTYQPLINGTIDDPIVSAVYSPDGSKIAYTKTGYKGIWVNDTRSNSKFQITDEDAAGFGFKWSSDSKSILTRVAKYEDGKRYNAVKIFDVESGKSLQLTDYKAMMPYLPNWMDGDTKVFLPAKDVNAILVSGKEKNNSISNSILAFEKNNNIVIKNLADNTEKSFNVIMDAQYLNVSSSPDGAKVIFEVLGGNMFVINSDGTGLVDLGTGYRPRWSSDSKKIIYMITEDDGHDFIASDIFIINADGTQKRNLTNTIDLLEMNPAFTPDGKSVVFDVVNDGSIYLINIE
jgi:hypothetical protein